MRHGGKWGLDDRETERRKIGPRAIRHQRRSPGDPITIPSNAIFESYNAIIPAKQKKEGVEGV